MLNNFSKKKFKQQYDLFYYEKKYCGKIIAGCDEAGRGPLAGPVVSAMVILDKNKTIEGINDSKKVSPKKRKKLFELIIDSAVDWSIGLVHNYTIDKINILQSTILSMRLAYFSLKIKPELLLVDAVKISNLDCPQLSIIKGDAKSVSIAAASILAKVFRDNLMEHYDTKYQGYNFAKHKGYGTKEHIANIKELGYSCIHRKSYKINFSVNSAPL
jgi:ribonuclease HII